MTKYTFKDVTAEVLAEINMVPGYDARKTLPKGLVLDKRIELVFPLLIKNIDKTAPELTGDRDEYIAKLRKNEDTTAIKNKLIAEAKKRNLPWLYKWGTQAFDDYFYLEAKQAAKEGQELILEKKKIDPKTADFVIETQGDHKPKLFAISIPENYFIPEKKLDRLFFHFHFRPNPAQAAERSYEPEDALQPVNKNLQGVLSGRKFYPYGWDYLFKNLWAYMYSISNLPNEKFITGLAYQAALSEKDVITIIPLLDIKKIDEEKIIKSTEFADFCEGIKDFITTEIKKRNPDFKFKEYISSADELLIDSNPTSPYRVSVSSNSNGCVYQSALFSNGIAKLNFVKEMYLFDPSQLESVHNNWVDAALLWGAKNPDKHIRVYTQPFKEFDRRINVIHARISKVNTIKRHRELRFSTIRSLAEINAGLLLTHPDLGESFKAKFSNTEDDPARQWRAIHSMIPGLCYTDALKRSGFTHFPQTSKIVMVDNKLLAGEMQSSSTNIKQIYFEDEKGIKLTADKYKYFIPYPAKFKLVVLCSQSGVNMSLNIKYSMVSKTIRFISNLSPYEVWIDPENDPDIFGDTSIYAYAGLANQQLSDMSYTHCVMDIIPFLTTIIKAKGWTVARKCMQQWFDNKYISAHNDKEKTVVNNILSMEWALQFFYVREKILATIQSTLFSTDESKKNIAEALKDMLTDNKITLPVNIGDSVVMGIDRNTIVTNAANYTAPEFDMYHFQVVELSPPYISSPLDDFMAAVNVCSLTFIAFGNVRRDTNASYTITVKSVGIYIKDWYDFSDNGNLGSWHVKTKDVGLLNATQLRGSTEVTNALFRNYRERYKIGQDYTNFSDIKKIEYTLVFRVNDALQVL